MEHEEAITAPTPWFLWRQSGLMGEKEIQTCLSPPVPGLSPYTSSLRAVVFWLLPHHPYTPIVWRAEPPRACWLFHPTSTAMGCGTPASDCIWLPRIQDLCRSCIREAIPGDTGAPEGAR